MSKPSAAEKKYIAHLANLMSMGLVRCACYSNRIAVERDHPKGPMWETGTGLKAHDWFVIPLSKAAHDEYHAHAGKWEAKYGTHADLLRTFWVSIGFVPGDFMTVGMAPKRAAWLPRVIGRLNAGWVCGDVVQHGDDGGD